MKTARFITLEGGEGVGKTTNLRFVGDFLRQRGIPVLTTREPGGTALGEAVRGMLLGHGRMTPQTELLLVFAARAQHLGEVIEPALTAGTWVVCDRFTDASFAYQGGGRGLPREFIAALEEYVQGARRPDLTLLLDAPIELGMERARGRNSADRFEAEESAFFVRVREAYLQQAEAEPERIRRVDASRSVERVQADIEHHLTRLLEKISP